MKVCNTCKESKEESQYYVSKGYIHHRCKLCSNKKTREWYEINQERRRRAVLKHYYKSRYGMSFEDIHKMFSSQNGKCLICGVDVHLKGTKDNTQGVIDHCHQTNIVRGIICNMCNKGLGLFRDNPEFLKQAIKYLKGEHY